MNLLFDVLFGFSSACLIFGSLLVWRGYMREIANSEVLEQDKKWPTVWSLVTGWVAVLLIAIGAISVWVLRLEGHLEAMIYILFVATGIILLLAVMIKVSDRISKKANEIRRSKKGEL